MNTKAIRQLADVTLDKYRSSIPRKAFEEFVKDIIAGENRATAFRYEASPIKHEIDDLVTVVHITREEATAWQH